MFYEGGTLKVNKRKKKENYENRTKIYLPFEIIIKIQNKTTK